VAGSPVVVVAVVVEGVGNLKAGKGTIFPIRLFYLAITIRYTQV